MMQNTRRGTSFEMREEMFKQRNREVLVSLKRQIDEIFESKSNKEGHNKLLTLVK